ncbi:hypothetical protein HHI36_001171 [Cryptolaemus montrouzieri]|uniref:Uncharacterized protein n=1 Tax=Cryptolaemus montrouzieri TaxID=559131 RepID=A0ABD2P777_9CUCU
MNSQKHKLVRFVYGKEHIPISYGYKIAMVSSNSLKFLGVSVDYRLDWGDHVDQLANDMARYVYARRTLSELVNVSTAFTAYNAYIDSRLRCGIVIWGNSSDILRLLLLQKRYICGILKLSKTQSCRAHFVGRSVLTVVSLYVYEAVMFILNNRDLFVETKREHEHNTRAENDMRLPRFKHTYLQNNSVYALLKIYNHIPQEARGWPQHMRRRLNTYLRKTPYYTLQEYFEDNICLS